MLTPVALYEEARQIYILASCECGSVKAFSLYNLKRVISCGCQKGKR